MKRLQWLEDQLDRDDLSLKLRRQYEDEADKLAQRMTIEAAANKRRKAEYDAEQERLSIEVVDNDLRDLARTVAGNQWNTPGLKSPLNCTLLAKGSL